MARVTKPLTNTQVSQAKPKDKEYTLSDGGGLQLRVRVNGTKHWFLNYYRPHTKKRAITGFGKYPEVSLADARQAAREAREVLAKGIDPGEHKADLAQLQFEAHANTFESVTANWFEVKKSRVTTAYAEDIWRSFSLHLFPSLGDVPIHKMKAASVIKVIQPISAKGSLETVRRLCQRVNEVMTFAVNTGLLEANPLAGISKAFQAPLKKNMPSLKPSELPVLLRALSLASIKLTTRCLIEWQLHTMTRPSEAAGARWDEIDFENSLWVIPAERMKKGREHRIPLTEQALGLLELMKPLSGKREHIFPADRNPRTHANEQTANAALKRMGFAGKLVAHGMRSIASTTLNEQGFDADVIEAALAHVDSNEVRAAYNRADYLERRKVMMSWWSEHIAQAATGSHSLAGSRAALRIIG